VRFYMNTSAWNRPFDDLSSPRVRLEADAVASLVAAAEDGRLDLVTSDYVDFEVSQNPDPERAGRVRQILARCVSRVDVTEAVAARARELEQTGLRGLDALHVAAAESAGVDALVTTDDRMLRRDARAGGRIAVRVLRPPDALSLTEVEDQP
jgi:predicted nucleic acid-binding protein